MMPTSRWALSWRLFEVVKTIILEVVRTLTAATARRVTNGTAAAQRRAYQGLVGALQRLGPTFVKFGQVAAVRSDALPATLCEELSRLHDAVTPMSRREAEIALCAARRDQPALRSAQVDMEPIGCGSIACVYRAVLAGGETVALKLKRPGIDPLMHCDLTLLGLAVRRAERLPKLRGMPIADLVAYVSKAILGQLDFDREGRNVGEIRMALASMPDVVVPKLRTALCTRGCLVFDYVPGLATDTPESLPDALRSRLATTALETVNKLFFVDGLVHCDLHPGNLYVTVDGRLVILDAGYCVRLPADVRDLMREFFSCLAGGDGRRCGEIVLESAVERDVSIDAEAFVSDFAALVADATGLTGGFEISTFGDAVYELQRRYGIYAASDFAFPLMSLMVVDGTVRRVWPDVDFKTLGAPAVAA